MSTSRALDTASRMFLCGKAGEVATKLPVTSIFVLQFLEVWCNDFDKLSPLFADVWPAIAKSICVSLDRRTLCLGKAFGVFEAA
jgi:hypothetical protein